MGCLELGLGDDLLRVPRHCTPLRDVMMCTRAAAGGCSEGETVISIFLALKYEPLYSTPRCCDVKNNNSDPN